MSNHYSAANLQFPGDDARLDFTDLWVFPAIDPGKTVVVIDVNPFATGMSAMSASSSETCRATSAGSPSDRVTRGSWRKGSKSGRAFR